ncbi:copper homeostasis protein CutC [Dellaglioa carnosa]|uniref:PF03932 family protein CutC n=1 Tax=Dellaglioa carnosa TaxID=2995136 RepID=A0ABT4JNC4_9LACO|nr:copper homeostasis protein CutC [Dellaglioa carnosa]MCZ2491828.1 copper homeostasis protein CutC [Dellaglioa carnosa]MCZ2494956.1 copper homeostasis protein CutC [Dellaglioa carnosa]MDK1731819.1 copper homeostasis protein CutC [Dellaglioa carnosa]
MLIKEVAVENFTDIPKQFAAGANRFELCDNLAVGGTTVSKGVMSETMRYAQDNQVPVMAMIRPRGGNFVYNDTELKIMEADLFQAQQLGVDGVVFGALDTDNLLDTDAMEFLIAASGGMQITFHMAFDEIPSDAQLDALAWLAEHDIDRVLTHGGSLDKPIEETLPHLQEIIDWSNGLIKIVPGGGITADNVDTIAAKLNVKELHGTKIVLK